MKYFNGGWFISWDNATDKEVK